MRRFLALLLAAVLALALAAPAYADVIWEPDNRFYETHADDCTLLQRSFYVNGGDGYVNLYTAPEGSSISGQISNGERVYAYWQYEDWGFVETEWGDGWVSLDELSLIYDYISFEEEYGDAFAPYDEETWRPVIEAWQGDTLVLWPYPGAEQASSVWQDAGDAMAELAEYGFSHTFTDEEGLTWGFCAYLYGRRNFWVCLDAPAGRDDPAVVSGEAAIPVRTVETPELVPAQEPVLPASYYLPIALVAGVVAVTAVALVLFYREKRNKAG